MNSKMVQNLIDRALAGEPEVVGGLVAVFVILVVTLYLLFGSKRRRGRSVLIVGLCDGGKTMLYSRLIMKKPSRTFTSMTANTGVYKPEKGSCLDLVDVPGHERVRQQIIEPLKSSTRALVFVVDSMTLQKEVKDVAEYLYTLFTDDVISCSAPPVLIVCNKHDLTMAKGAKVIQSQLEKEINTLRTTRSSALASTTETSNNNTFLGSRNKDFQFSDLRPFKVEFAECSAKDGDVGKVIEFLDRIA